MGETRSETQAVHQKTFGKYCLRDRRTHSPSYYNNISYDEIELYGTIPELESIECAVKTYFLSSGKGMFINLRHTAKKLIHPIESLYHILDSTVKVVITEEPVAKLLIYNQDHEKRQATIKLLEKILSQ